MVSFRRVVGSPTFDAHREALLIGSLFGDLGHALFEHGLRAEHVGAGTVFRDAHDVVLGGPLNVALTLLQGGNRIDGIHNGIHGDLLEVGKLYRKLYYLKGMVQGGTKELFFGCFSVKPTSFCGE